MNTTSKAEATASESNASSPKELQSTCQWRMEDEVPDFSLQCGQRESELLYDRSDSATIRPHDDMPWWWKKRLVSRHS